MINGHPSRLPKRLHTPQEPVRRSLPPPYSWARSRCCLFVVAQRFARPARKTLRRGRWPPRRARESQRRQGHLASPGRLARLCLVGVSRVGICVRGAPLGPSSLRKTAYARLCRTRNGCRFSRLDAAPFRNEDRACSISYGVSEGAAGRRWRQVVPRIHHKASLRHRSSGKRCRPFSLIPLRFRACVRFRFIAHGSP